MQCRLNMQKLFPLQSSLNLQGFSRISATFRFPGAGEIVFIFR